MKPKARHKARRLVIQALYQLQLAKTPAFEVHAEYLAQDRHQKADLDYFSELFLGITEYQETLNKALEPLMDRKITELTPIEYGVLRLGAYELIHCLAIPYRVVINEAVIMSKVFGAQDAHKYVNGVLDKLAREHRAVEIANPALQGASLPEQDVITTSAE